MTKKTKTERQHDKAHKLFDAFVGHLTEELKGDPSDAVIKESRSFLKDFSYMIDLQDARATIGQVANAGNNVHPFPVNKEA